MKRGFPTLYTKLVSHIKKKPVSFHVPGHKMGKGFNPSGKKYYDKILKLDMTEISGLDDLHNPTDVILDAEKRAARIFKASKTFFLVNGSTVGNIAMIQAVCSPSDKIIVQKNVHKSVINGLILARANPIYINNECIPELGIAGSIDKDSLVKVLKNHADAKAVFLMNPNYYGVGINLREIISLVHEYDLPVLVDEAHGAHFGLHPSLPKSAMDSGADMVVNSTHKTLSAMTMGSMLHVNSNLIDIDRLKMFLSMLQSSSPSYPILASLDLTCEWIETKKEQLFDDVLKSVDVFKEDIKSLKHIKINHIINEKYYMDPLKIIINVGNKNFTGIDVQKLLEEKMIFTELADTYNTLAIATIGTSKQDLNRLYKALREIDQFLVDIADRESDKDSDFTNVICSLQNPQSELSIEKIIYGKNKLVPLEDSVGQVATEMIIPYPPGIPLVQIGEIITEDIIEHIIYIKKIGIDIYGLRGESLNKIKVVKDSC